MTISSDPESGCVPGIHRRAAISALKIITFRSSAAAAAEQKRGKINP
jgi:hypothetical protein